MSDVSNRHNLSLDEQVRNYEENQGAIHLREMLGNNNPVPAKHDTDGILESAFQPRTTTTSGGILERTWEHVSEGAKGVAQGWYIDLFEDAITMAEAIRPEDKDKDSLWNTKVVVNTPLFNNYDKDRDFISLIPNSEFMRMKKEKQISYLPQFVDPDSVTGQFTRTFAKIGRGLSWGNRLLWGRAASKKGATTLMKEAPVAGRALDWFGPSAFASQVALSPYEDRIFTETIANDVATLIENTPIEGLQPFFDWVAASDEDTEAEARFKMFLETVVTDAMFAGVFRMYKGARAALKKKGVLTDNKKAKEFIESAQEVDQKGKVLKSEVHTNHQEPPKKSKVDEILEAKGKEGEVGPVTVSGYDVFRSPLAMRQLVRDIIDGDVRNGPIALTERVFNTAYLTEVDAQQALEIFNRTIKSELLRGKKSFTDISEEGQAIAEAYQIKVLKRVSAGVEDTAERLDLDKDALLASLSVDARSVIDIDSRMLAYRVMISQLGSDLNHVATSVLNNPMDTRAKAELLNLVDYLEKVLVIHGRMRGSIARTVTSHRIPIYKLDKQSDVPFADIEKLQNALKASGVDDIQINILAEAIKHGDDTLQKARNAIKGHESATRRGVRGVSEFYRSLLLTSIKTHVTNTVSGGIETVLVPTSHMIGGVLGKDMETVKFASREMLGFFLALPKAGLFMLKSMLDERNILDPMGTKVDGLWSPYGPAIAMKMVDKSAWHPKSWLVLAVNTTGKIARFSIRILGGEDEFFKQLNYRMRAYAEITGNIPENIGNLKYFSKQRKEYVKKELAKYFDDNGMATNKDALLQAQRVTFTQNLRKGTLANRVHDTLQKTKFMPLQFFIPFVRTPANIFDTFKIRTPGLNKYIGTHREMLASDNPIERAQALGNTAIGMMLYGTTMGFIMSGRVTGSGPIDPDRNKIWRTNNEPYSFKYPNGEWISYNRFDPGAMPFAYLASAWENMYEYAEDPEDLNEIIFMGIAGFLKAATDRTYLQGMKQMFDIANDIISGNADQPVRAFSRLGANIIPPIINQVSDLTGLKVYEGAEGFHEAFTFMDQINRRLTPLNGYNAIKHNWITGEPMLTPQGFSYGVPMGKHDSNDIVIKELVAMGRSFSPPSPDIKGVPLSAEQYSDLTRIIGTLESNGKTLYEKLDEIMRSEEYDYKEGRVFDPDYDDQRVMVVKAVMRKFKEAGKALMIKSKDMIEKYPDLGPKIKQHIDNKENVVKDRGRLFELHETPSTPTRAFGSG